MYYFIRFLTHRPPITANLVSKRSALGVHFWRLNAGPCGGDQTGLASFVMIFRSGAEGAVDEDSARPS